MYTVYRTGFGKFSQIYHIRTREYGHKPGHQRQKEKKTPSRRKPHGLLNTRMHFITPDLYAEDGMRAMVNVTTKENLDLLYRSIMKYTQLLGVELPYHLAGGTSTREKIYLLYNVLDSIVSHHVNPEPVGDRPQFCIYHFHEWPDYTLLLIPIDLMERLEGEIKRIALELIRRFIRYYGMMDITDIPYLEMSGTYIDYVDFEQLDKEGKKDLYRKEKLFGSYEKGKVRRKPCRVHSRAFYRNLEEHIRSCSPSSNKEERFLELTAEGMSLVAKDSPRTSNYDYDYANERERDFEPPSLRYQILPAYFITDTVTKDMESCFSTDCQEACNQTPVSLTFIIPETEELFRPESYLERFSKWFGKFVGHATYNL